MFSELLILKSFSQDQQQETTSDQNVQATQQVTTQPENQAQAQVATVSKPKPFADELPISDQFNYAIDKSSNFQDYKVIKQAWMSKLKTNTLDTLGSLKSKLGIAENKIKSQSEKIESLESAISTAQSELKFKNSFSFFGILVSKAAYDTIMWSIIIGLIVLLGFLFVAFRRSFAVAAQIKKDLDEAKEEFEEYRKKALKSKEEAVRQLYNELNKYKNKK